MVGALHSRHDAALQGRLSVGRVVPIVSSLMVPICVVPPRRSCRPARPSRAVWLTRYRVRYGVRPDAGGHARGGSTDRRDHRRRPRGRARRHPHGARARGGRVPGRRRSGRRARRRSARCASTSPDLLTLDLTMPGGSSLAALPHLLRRPSDARGGDPDDARGSRVRAPGAAGRGAQLRAEGGRAGRAAAGLPPGGRRRQLPAPAARRADGHRRGRPRPTASRCQSASARWCG